MTITPGEEPIMKRYIIKRIVVKNGKAVSVVAVDSINDLSELEGLNYDNVHYTIYDSEFDCGIVID